MSFLRLNVPAENTTSPPGLFFQEAPLDLGNHFSRQGAVSSRWSDVLLVGVDSEAVTVCQVRVRASAALWPVTEVREFKSLSDK